MSSAPFMLFDMDDQSSPADDRARLMINRHDFGLLEVGCWEDASESARGAAIKVNYAQLNMLHEHLGLLLFASGVTMREGMPDAPEHDALRKARALLRRAFDVAADPDLVPRLSVGIDIARWLFENDSTGPR